VRPSSVTLAAHQEDLAKNRPVLVLDAPTVFVSGLFQPGDKRRFDVSHQ